MVNESHYGRMPLFKAWRPPASAPLCACLALFHCLLGGAHSLAECDSFSTLHVQMPFSLCENVLCILIWLIASYIFFLKKCAVLFVKGGWLFLEGFFFLPDFIIVLPGYFCNSWSLVSKHVLRFILVLSPFLVACSCLIHERCWA